MRLLGGNDKLARVLQDNWAFSVKTIHAGSTGSNGDIETAAEQFADRFEPGDVAFIHFSTGVTNGAAEVPAMKVGPVVDTFAKIAAKAAAKRIGQLVFSLECPNASAFGTITAGPVPVVILRAGKHDENPQGQIDPVTKLVSGNYTTALTTALEQLAGSSAPISFENLIARMGGEMLTSQIPVVVGLSEVPLFNVAASHAAAPLDNMPERVVKLPRIKVDLRGLNGSKLGARVVNALGAMRNVEIGFGARPDIVVDYPRDIQNRLLTQDRIYVRRGIDGAIMADCDSSAEPESVVTLIKQAVNRFGQQRILGAVQNSSAGKGKWVEMRILACEVKAVNKSGQETQKGTAGAYAIHKELPWEHGPIAFREQAELEYRFAGLKPGGDLAVSSASPGEHFVIQYRVHGNWNPYLTVLDCMSDQIHELFPLSVMQEVRPAQPTTDWQYLTFNDQVETFKVTEPFGRENIDMLATEEPIDAGTIEKLESTSPDPGEARSIDTSPFKSKMLPDGTVEVRTRLSGWATAMGALDVVPPHALARPQRVYALVVAVDHYQDRHFPDLRYPAQDARDFVEALKSGGTQPELSEVLVNPTRSQILQCLLHVSRQLGPDDEMVLVLSGHTAEVDGKFYFLPSDTVEPRLQGIEFGFFYRALAAVPARNQLLVADLYWSASSYSSVQSVVNQQDAGPNNFCFFGMNRNPNPDIASSGFESTEYGHSILMHSLLESLRNHSKDDGVHSILKGAAATAKRLSGGAIDPFVVTSGDDFAMTPAAAEKGAATLFASTEPDVSGISQQQDPTRAITPSDATASKTYTRRGKDYVLFIETDKPDHARVLNNPKVDVEMVGNALQQYGFVQLPMLGNWTCTNARTQLEMYREKDSPHPLYGPDDQLLVYVAGHGDVSDVNEAYAILKDTIPGQVPQNDLRFSLLFKYLSDSKFGHVCVIFDVCHAGVFPNDAVLPGAGPLAEPPAIPFTDPFGIAMSTLSHHAVASAFGDAQDGKSGEGSPFAQALTRILREADGPRLRLSTVEDKLRDAKELTNANQTLITGEFGKYDPRGLFMFVRK